MQPKLRATDFEVKIVTWLAMRVTHQRHFLLFLEKGNKGGWKIGHPLTAKSLGKKTFECSALNAKWPLRSRRARAEKNREKRWDSRGSPSAHLQPLPPDLADDLSPLGDEFVLDNLLQLREHVAGNHGLVEANHIPT